MQRDIVRRGKLSFFGSVSGKATAGERQHREIWISIARARFGRRGSAKGMEATRGRALCSDPAAIRVPDSRRLSLGSSRSRGGRSTACSRARCR